MIMKRKPVAITIPAGSSHGLTRTPGLSLCGAFNDCSATKNVPNHSEASKEENKTPSSKESKGRHKNKKTSPSGIPKPSPTGWTASGPGCSKPD